MTVNRLNVCLLLHCYCNIFAAMFCLVRWLLNVYSHDHYTVIHMVIERDFTENEFLEICKLLEFV